MRGAQMTNRPSHYNTKYKMDLSPRERDVIALVTKGKTNGEIAHDLNIAFDTVKWHVSGVLSKLGVESREEAAAYWRQYNSLGGRVARTWNAVIGFFGGAKVVSLAAGSVAVVGAGAIAVLAIMMSLAGRDEPPPESSDALATAPRVGAPSQLPAGASMPLVQSGSLVFIPTSRGLASFDPATRVSQLVRGTTPGPLGASETGDVWTTGDVATAIVQVDPSTRAISRSVDVPFPVDDTTFIYANGGAVYVAFWAYDAIVRIDGSTGTVAAVAELAKPKGAVLAGGYLWVALARRDSVVKLDPATLAIKGEVPLGTAKDNPICGGCVQWVYAAEDSVWVLSTEPAQVTRVDALTSEVAGTLRIPGKLLPALAAAGPRDVWVGVTPPGTVHGQLVRVAYDTIQEAERVDLGAGRGKLDAISPAGLSAQGDTVWVATEQGEIIPVRSQP